MRTTILLLLFLLVPTAQGDPLDAPFTVHNANPFVSIYGLPRGGLDDNFAVRYTVASSFDAGSDGGRSVVLDGETERLEFSAVRALGDYWQVGIDIPWVRHSGGYLDDLIIDWHDWFDLPQNGRDTAPQDLLRFGFADAQGAIGVFDDQQGLGDVSLSLARDVAGFRARATLKLPTGEPDDLLGSGGADVALSVARDWRLGQRWDAHVALGATWLDDGDVLPDYVRPVVGTLRAKMGFRAAPWLALKVQWDVHTQVYERVRLRHLNEIAYVLSFGGTLRTGDYLLDVVVTENYPHPEITPDVAFQLGLRRAF